MVKKYPLNETCVYATGPNNIYFFLRGKNNSLLKNSWIKKMSKYKHHER